MKAFLTPSLFCCFLPLFFLSCGQIKEPDFRSIENVRVSKFGLNNSSLTLDLHYFYPNNFRLKLKHAEGDAWIENSYIGHFTIDTLVQVPAQGDFVLPVKLRVDMSKVLKNSLVVFLAKEATIKVEGRARVGKGPVFINYPIRYEGKQDLDRLTK